VVGGVRVFVQPHPSLPFNSLCSAVRGRFLHGATCPLPPAAHNLFLALTPVTRFCPCYLQHVGDLFMAMSAVNLLSRVLDTPDSITSAPDNIGSLYKSVSGVVGCRGGVQWWGAVARRRLRVCCGTADPVSLSWPPGLMGCAK